jgi:hypothetical protein
MDRKRVFKLMAMGRITAAEAERLLIARQASRESSWILIACIGIALAAELNAGTLPVVTHLAHTLRVTEWVHGALAMVMQLMHFS